KGLKGGRFVPQWCWSRTIRLEEALQNVLQLVAFGATSPAAADAGGTGQLLDAAHSDSGIFELCRAASCLRQGVDNFRAGHHANESARIVIGIFRLPLARELR